MLKVFAWIGTEKLILLIFSFIVNALMARLMGASLYGEFVFLATLFTVLVQVSDFGYRNIFIVNYPKGDTEELGYYILVRSFGIVVSSILAVIVFYYKNIDVMYLALIIFSLVFYTADLFEAEAVSSLQYKKAVLVRVTAGILMNGVRLVLLTAGVDVVFILMSFLIDPLTKLLLLGHSVSFENVNLSNYLLKIKQAAPLVLSMLFLQLLIKLPYFIMPDLLGPVEYGYFAAAFRLFEPMLVVGGLLSLVVNPYLARVKDFNAAYEMYLGVVFWVAVLGSAIMFFMSEWFVGLIYGHEFLHSVVYMKILSLSLPLIFIGSCSGFWYVKNQLFFYALLKNLLPLTFLFIVNSVFGIEFLYAWLISLFLYAFLIDAIFTRTRGFFFMKLKALIFTFRYVSGRTNVWEI